MRVRCPKRDCPIDVPDDFAGARIRCPHCGHLFIVEPAERDEQIQAATPLPKPKEPTNLEDKIYDGLPPLSVMIALRRQKGMIDPDDIRRFEMTDDDWRALAAFETLLRACVSLRASLVLGGAAVVCNFLVVGLDAGGRYASLVSSISVGLILFGAVIYLGSKALANAQLGFLLDLLFWATAGAMLLVGGLAGFSVYHLPANGPSALIVGGVCFIVSVALAEASIRVWWATRKIEPPEIAHRLSEALRQLGGVTLNDS